MVLCGTVLGPVAEWRALATSRQIARVRDNETMQRVVWRKNPNTILLIGFKKSCPFGEKWYQKEQARKLGEKPRQALRTAGIERLARDFIIGVANLRNVAPPAYMRCA